MSPTETTFLSLLRSQLWNKTPDIQQPVDWRAVMHLCRIHGTEPLVYNEVLKLDRTAYGITDDIYNAMKQVCMANMLAYRQHLALLTRTWSALTSPSASAPPSPFPSREGSGMGLSPVLLKGFSLAQLYSQPDLRSWGDLDVYVGPQAYHEAAARLRAAFPHAEHHEEESEELKHYCFVMPEGVVEMHRSTIKMDHPRDARLYSRLEAEAMPPQFTNLQTYKFTNLPICLPEAKFNLLFTFMHAWNHFVESGVGMKQLCDLCLLATHTAEHLLTTDEQKREYARYMRTNLQHLHLWEAWQIVGYTCTRFLGLSRRYWVGYSEHPKYYRRRMRFFNTVLHEGLARPHDYGNAKDRYEAREQAMQMNIIRRKLLTLRSRMATSRFVRHYSPTYARHLLITAIRKGIRRTLRHEPMVLYTALCCLMPLSAYAKWVKVTDTSLTEGTYAIIETKGNKALANIEKIGESSVGQATKNAFEFEDGAAYSVPEGTMLLNGVPEPNQQGVKLIAADNQHLVINQTNSTYAPPYIPALSNGISYGFWALENTNRLCFISPKQGTQHIEFTSELYSDGTAFGARAKENKSTNTQLVRKEKDETRSVSANTYGTLCLPRAVKAGEFSGAEFYRILYREGDAAAPTALILELVESLEAGMPYIYFTTDTEMSWFLSGPSGTAGNENGLVGTLTKIEDSNILQGKWYISNNEICQIGEKCTLAANRAYIDMSLVPTQAQATPVPGRKQIRLGQPGTATFIPLHHISNTADKILLNNTILIQRENHLYDMQGRVVR